MIFIYICAKLLSNKIVLFYPLWGVFRGGRVQDNFRAFFSVLSRFCMGRLPEMQNNENRIVPY